PAPPVEQVLDALVRAGVLVRVAQRDEPGYDPGRDLDAVRLVDVEDAVRLDPDARPLKNTLAQAIGPELSAVLRARHGVAGADSGNLTLRQLAATCAVNLEPAPADPRGRH